MHPRGLEGDDHWVVGHCHPVNVAVDHRLVDRSAFSIGYGNLDGFRRKASQVALPVGK